jgi:hypothetical protein
MLEPSVKRMNRRLVSSGADTTLKAAASSAAVPTQR